MYINNFNDMRGSSMLPIFRKPKHKEKVIATSQGWVVERTGEVLSRIRDLDKKILSTHGTLSEIIAEQPEVEVNAIEESVQDAVETDEIEELPQDVVEESVQDAVETEAPVVEEKVRRKPGRKPGPKPKK